MEFVFVFLVVWMIAATARIASDYKVEAARLRVSLYPTVLGVILARKKKEQVKKSLIGEQETNYLITTTYRYFWQGEERKGEKIAPLLSISESASQAIDLFSQLEEQRQVKVYVNPQQPDESYLSPGTAVFSWRYALAALFFGYALPMTVLYLFIQAEIAYDLSTTLLIIK